MNSGYRHRFLPFPPPAPCPGDFFAPPGAGFLPKIPTLSWCLLALLLSVSSPLSHADEPPASPLIAGDVVREYVQSQEQLRFEALQEEFGRHKALPPGYELQALLPAYAVNTNAP